MSSPTLAKATSRWPVAQGKRELFVSLSTAAPAQAEVQRYFLLEVPKDCGLEDDLVIQQHRTKDLIEARMAELSPQATTALEMRLKIAVERIVGSAIQELLNQATESLRVKGY